MTKLSGTSGPVFSGLAESLNMRGTSRSGKGAGTKAQAESSFNDLLHTVSNLAKRALNDEGSDTAVKAGTLRTRLAHQSGKDKATDETVHERTASVEEPGSSEKPTEKSSDKKIDKSSGKHGPLDDMEQADVQSRSSIAGIIGQEIVAGQPVVMPQMQAPAGDKKDASGREERSSTTKRDVQGMGTAKATTAEPPSPAAPTAAHSQAAASHATATDQATSADGSEPSPTQTAPGFEAIAANVERAAKASTRDALPETTKVTVVQQETHLPPAQFNAPQQVANVVVAELKEAPAPTASAAPDLAASQANAPDQPLKILTINLEPPALGNVTVRLRLVGNEVSVHLAAERKDTSQMLDQQRDSIRDLMQSAGYVAEIAPVQHGSLDGFQSGSGQSQPQLSGQQQSSSQSQGTFDGTSNSSGQSDGGAKQARQERQSNQETRHDQDVAPQIRRGPVYL
ncbi:MULTISPECIES: flagellar hook-length control protein FliK [unclassified Bradyrhizobium]|uniref:flagellar hook-length control protein FliK n=1 Tax=unclassified Bradyrhizobium TaxID=2631580 RepID=UPI0023B0CDBB|nr:flagellar hook-length control protein FliK [Bradyrhizobium sp. CSS354]MDE5461204.1 flagellar hook-length control protein FliK [Bradyrhizobium sp. CSS354]